MRTLTGHLRFVVRDGRRILQQEWITATWPHEPYREKGEEAVTLEWRDVPEVAESNERSTA